MENSSTVMFFYFCGLQKTWLNKFVYFPLTLLTYLLIILVNLTLIITIILEKGLHEPMYIFLCNLCINALYGTAGFYPRFLSDLLSDDQVISYGGCVTQGFVIYTSVLCEITLLTAMAYDRYVAICKPLQYHTLLRPVTVGKIIVLAWCYPLLLSVITVFLTVRLPLCGSRICKFFCDNGSVLQHSCVPFTLNRILSAFIVTGQVLQVILIGWSYLQITRVCLRSEEGRLKFTQTCVPHLMTMVIFLVVTFFDVFNSLYGDQNMPLNLRNLMALQFLIVPPVFNPVIYGLNLQKVRTTVFIRKDKICYLFREYKGT